MGQFTKNCSGFYINAATNEVADFEQILTHKVADILKYSILLTAIGLYTCSLYLLVGTKNETLTQSMKEYSDISYHYEKAVLPIGFGFRYCSTLALAFCIVSSVRAWLAGALSPATLVILIMLALFVGKVNMTEFIALTSYRNLTLSKNKIQGIFQEREEPAESPAFAPKGTEIRFEDVDFSYVEGEPVLKKAGFTIPAGRTSGRFRRSRC